MSLLTPLGLLAALLALPILVLYMLKLRRKEVEISSTFLWKMVLRDRQANAPWQRLRHNLLLLLQLLVLAALTLALSRPAIPVPAVASGSVVLVLDASASMNATDTAPTRFAAALASARGIVKGLESGASMTIILAGRQPVVLAAGETSQAALQKALDSPSLSPGQGPANWPAAFALAAGATSSIASIPGSKVTTVVLSDGGIPTDSLPPLPGEVRYVPIGTSADNLAISALSLRSGAQGVELFTRITNYGPQPRAVVLSFYRDGQLFNSQNANLPGSSGAGGASITVLQPGLPQQAAIYKAQLSLLEGQAGAVDALALDDTAFAVYQPPRSGRTLIASQNKQGNLFLEQALAALPGLTPFRVLPGADGKVNLPEDPFDLYVFDGWMPDTLPKGSLLLVNPPTNPLFDVGGVYTDTQHMQVLDHPLTRYVDWSGVHVSKAEQIQPPVWATTLVRTEQGPLVFAGESEGRRIAVLAFDLHDSDLPLQVTFPIMMANLTSYLVPPAAFEAPDGLQPGQSLVIQPQLVQGETPSSIAIATPQNQVYTLVPGPNGVLFNETGQLGVYAVNYLGQPGTANVRPADYFAVNLFSPGESDIRPAESIQVGRTSVSPASRQGIGQREFWPWLAALGLLVLVLEWWVYHRRQTPPRQPAPGIAPQARG